MKSDFHFHLIFSFLLLFSCTKKSSESAELVNISLEERHGSCESISNKKRLKEYAGIDFTSPQPYSKVSRIYKKEKLKTKQNILTSYYPHGQIKEYLEGESGSAKGLYREWHSNGELKLEAQLIGGRVGLDEQSKASWLFEGLAKAFYDNGNLEAEILYLKAQLSGISQFYYRNGSLKEKICYQNNLREGRSEYRDQNGKILSIENYEKDLLLDAEYPNRPETVKAGKGFKLSFKNGKLIRKEEFQDGRLEGLVEEFKDGKVKKSYQIVSQKKQGREIHFDHLEREKLCLNWNQNHLSGECKSYYPSGEIQSCFQMQNNQKDGLSLTYYPDGSYMMLEQYQSGKLEKGQYFKRGQKQALSKVLNGKGLATIFNCEGRIEKRISYLNGEAQIS